MAYRSRGRSRRRNYASGRNRKRLSRYITIPRGGIRL